MTGETRIYNKTDKTAVCVARGNSFHIPPTTGAGVGYMDIPDRYAAIILSMEAHAVTDKLYEVPGQEHKRDAAPEVPPAKTDWAPTIAQLTIKELIGAIRLLSLGEVSAASLSKLSEDELRTIALEWAAKR